MIVFTTSSADSQVLKEIPFTGGMVRVDAGRIEVRKDEGLVEATGGILLEYQGRKIRADRGVYYFEKGMMEAIGNVTFTDEGVQFTCEKIIIDLGTGRVVLEDGVLRVKDEHLFVQAARFVELRKDLFSIEDGMFSTCDQCDKRDWEIGIGSGKVKMGGYATGRNITLKVRGTPLFWLPFAFFPAKTERETGFLMPNFSTDSNRGTRFTLPFYIVTSDFSDLTLYFDYMTKRGYKPAAEFRYRLTENSSGTLLGEFVNDREKEEERYRFFYETWVTGDFPFFMNGRVDYPSDEEYFLDFHDDIGLRTARQLISDGSFGFEGDSVTVEVGGTYIQNLDPALSGKDSIHVAPSLVFRVKKKRLLGPVFASGSLSFRNFYSAVEGGTPKGALDFKLDLVEKVADVFILSGKARFYGGAYNGKDSAGERKVEKISYVDSTVSLKTQLERFYGKMSHTFEPMVSIQKTDRLTSLPHREFEPYDRAPEKTRVIAGLDNTLRREGEILGTLSLKYSYDLERERNTNATLLDPFSPYFRNYQDQVDIAVEGSLSDDRRSDVFISGEFYPLEGGVVGGEAFYNTKFGRMDKYTVKFRYRKAEDLEFQGSLRHTRTLATDLNLFLSFLPFRWLKYRGWIDYSLKDNVIIENTSYFEYIPKSECWSVTFGVSRKTRPAETTYSVFFSLRGIGTIGK